MVSLFHKPQLSKVNARHLLDDLVDSYSYSVQEAVLVETIANALDAECRNISFRIDSKNKTLAIEDDGLGMNEMEFKKYHDLAESRKERGKGIGFAGLGAKLAHKITRKIITETRSKDHKGATEWYFKGDDLLYKPIRAKGLQRLGTRVALFPKADSVNMLDRSFIENTIKHHYGALLDPYLSQLYVWDAIYPQGVNFYIDGSPMPKQPLVLPGDIQDKRECDIMTKRRKRIGLAVFALMKQPLPEEMQGIGICTYGKTIRRDSLGLHPRDPDRITGWVESPSLVECLTTDKQNFIEHGTLGEKYKRIRREIQKACGEWLKEIGESPEPEQSTHAPRILELETARLIRHIPQLRYLFEARTHEDTATPDPSGDGAASLANMMQMTRGDVPGQGGGEGIPVSPGAENGKAPTTEPPGEIKTRNRPRHIRSGPSIEISPEPSRKEISWVAGDTVVINSEHVAYIKAAKERNLKYHQRIAILYALCKEASVEPEEQFDLLNKALTIWGKL